MKALTPFFQKLKVKKWPSARQWRQVLRFLTKKEKVALLFLSVVFLISFIFLLSNFYFKNTEIKPIPGGSFKEGVIGYPRFINPIYSDLSEVDRDLVQLLFSGLMKYNDAGEIVPDLIEEYKILEKGRVFEISLKKGFSWHDGEKIDIDDVIFTIETIQNPDYKSPLRAAWIGVGIEKISETSLRFRLNNPSAIFLENLTLKILPRHIWENISPEKFFLSSYNLQPIGSGSYRLKSINQNKDGQIESLTLTENIDYFGQRPKIKEITFVFFDSEEKMVKAAQQREIQGFSLLSPGNEQLFQKIYFEKNTFLLPRYFAVFFNQENSEILKNKEVRQALNYGTDKTEIVSQIAKETGRIIDSPILPEFYGFQDPAFAYEFNKDAAQELLEKAGFLAQEEGKRIKTIKRDSILEFTSELKLNSRGAEVRELQKCISSPPAGSPEIYPPDRITGIFDQETRDGVIRFQEKFAGEILEPWGFTKGTGIVGKTTRSKLNELCDLSPEAILPLEIVLTVPNQPLLVRAAELLKERWEDLGAEIIIEKIDSQTLEREIIKPRNYQALLFGNVLFAIPDPLPFWHSLQKKDPGLNLALFENKEVDKLLEEARQELDSEIRAQKLEKFQDILIAEAPVIFLFSQDYVYFTSKEIKGIPERMIVDPSKRFSGIENWYIRTKRVWR